jgi:hypothetical protein
MARRSPPTRRAGSCPSRPAGGDAIVSVGSIRRHRLGWGDGWIAHAGPRHGRVGKHRRGAGGRRAAVAAVTGAAFGAALAPALQQSVVARRFARRRTARTPITVMQPVVDAAEQPTVAGRGAAAGVAATASAGGARRHAPVRAADSGAEAKGQASKGKNEETFHGGRPPCERPYEGSERPATIHENATTGSARAASRPIRNRRISLPTRRNKAHRGKLSRELRRSASPLSATEPLTPPPSARSARPARFGIPPPLRVLSHRASLD